MATCRWIVNAALRKIGRLGAGREARTADAADALAALQGLYGAWVASGAFGRLADVIPLTNCTAGENQRIMRDPAVVTVDLPDTVPAYAQPLPYDRERDTYDHVYEAVDGANRPPRDGAVVQLVDTVGGGVQTYVYDGTLRNWTVLESLQLDMVAPRSVSDPEGLSAALALELADTFGAEVGPTTLAQARRYMTGLITSFSRPREAVIGVYA